MPIGEQTTMATAARSPIRHLPAAIAVFVMLAALVPPLQASAFAQTGHTWRLLNTLMYEGVTWGVNT